MTSSAPKASNVATELAGVLSSYLQPLKNALEVCIEQHQGTCDQQRHTLLPLSADRSRIEPRDVRVIDIKESKIIRAPPNCRYVALSYVWEHRGIDQESISYSVNSDLDLSRLPRTILDAIAVCEALDEQYLWIDALCIKQDDEVDKKHQMDQMDKIYSFAAATIIGACDKDPGEGLPSLQPQRSICLEHPQPDILDETLWSTRSWTYQEFVLSRRLLLFTSNGVYFHCAAEEIPLNGWGLPSLSHNTGWDFHNKSLDVYSSRRISRKSDTLNAITGVQRILARYTDDTYLCGLPARQIFYAILWQPLAVAERQLSWPSWSWAGWTGIDDCLCLIGNPSHRAVSGQWGDSPAKWGSNGRVFIPLMENLRFQSSGDVELHIPLFPGDDELKQYLNRNTKSQDSGPTLTDDKPFFETGYLRFRTTTMRFCITADTENPTVSKQHPLLKRCRILRDEKWIGTIFLNPDSSGNYPDISEPCEFISLTRFKAYNNLIHTSYLDGLLETEPNSVLEPAVFPAHYYEAAKREHQRQFDAWKSGKYHAKIGYSMRAPLRHQHDRDPHRGMPYPPHFDCSHVMWIGRKGDFVYRKAVGIVAGIANHFDGVKTEEFCLG